jgi:chaperonin GroES
MMSKTKLEPLGARVLLRFIEQEGKTSAGLLLPEASREKPQVGEVVAVGEDEEIKVKVGQKVLFPKFTGTDIRLDGVDHIILNAADLLAVFKE